jgi:hypothetical protein
MTKSSPEVRIFSMPALISAFSDAATRELGQDCDGRPTHPGKRSVTAFHHSRVEEGVADKLIVGNGDKRDEPGAACPQAVRQVRFLGSAEGPFIHRSNCRCIGERLHADRDVSVHVFFS